jgi:hypothetical protein
MENPRRRLPPGAGPGRPKGVPNKATVEIRQFCRAFVHDPKYLEAATRRVIAGKSPQLELLIWQYAYGRPKTAEEVEAQDRPREPRVTVNILEVLGTLPTEALEKLEAAAIEAEKQAALHLPEARRLP